jgi:hypothetical protein
MSVTLVEPGREGLEQVLQATRVEVNAVKAERPPAAMAGRFALVLLHARDALGDDVASAAREFVAPEGRVAFVRPVKVLLRPPPGLVEQWERHWGHALRTPQELLGGVARGRLRARLLGGTGHRRDGRALRRAPDELAEEAALYRAGAAAISFAIAVGRRREPDEKPRRHATRLSARAKTLPPRSSPVRAAATGRFARSRAERSTSGLGSTTLPSVRSKRHGSSRTRENFRRFVRPRRAASWRPVVATTTLGGERAGTTVALNGWPLDDNV